MYLKLKMKDLLRYPLAMEGVYAPGGPAQAESQLYCGPKETFSYDEQLQRY